MRTIVCDMLGIDVPIFAFTHCRDVVVEVSKAGGPSSNGSTLTWATSPMASIS